MSAQYSSYIYKSPEKFLAACAASLLATRDVAANFALGSTYALLTEGHSQECEDNTWVAVTGAGGQAESKLVFTLCVVGRSSPVVLASSVDPFQLSRGALEKATTTIAVALDATGLPNARLTSVVGPRALADPFVDAWARLRGLKRNPMPILHKYTSFVTPATLRPPVRAATNMHVRIAQAQDLDATSRMYWKFTALSPHPITEEMAREQVKSLVASGRLYACELEGMLVGMAIVSRVTPGVHAIGRVWTNEDARRKGVAEVMVREMCKR